MFAVVVALTLKPGTSSAFLPHMMKNAAESLNAEKDCHQFDVATDPERPEDILLYELYTNAAAFDTHLATPHFKAFDAATADFIAEKKVMTYSRVNP